MAKLPDLQGDPTRIVVISDLHITAEAAGGWKLYHRTIDRLQTALENALGPDIDGLVITGDLTRDGTPAEFDIVSNQLMDLPCPHVALPGNHDLPTRSGVDPAAATTRFFDEYVGEAFPCHRQFGDIDVVGLNSMDTGENLVAAGAISAPQLRRLDATLSTTNKTIVMLHHPVAEAWPKEVALPPSHFRLANAGSLKEILHRHNVPLVVSGHAHWPLVSHSDTITEIVAPAVCSYPQAYLSIEILPNGTTLTMHPLPDLYIQQAAYENLYADRPMDGAYVETAQNDTVSGFRGTDLL